MQEESSDSIQKFYNAVDRALPGEDVRVAGDLWIRVFPMRFAHAEPYIDEIQKLFNEIMQGATKDGQVNESVIRSVLPNAIKKTLGGLSGMVQQACVAWQGKEGAYADDASKRFDGKPELDRMPMAVQAECVAKWITLSLSEDHLGPLAGSVEEYVHRLTGRKLSIRSWLSNFWSQIAVTPGMTSSTDQENSGPMTDGRSLSSEDVLDRPGSHLASSSDLID